MTLSQRAFLLSEPELRFGFGQSSPHPKDGLFLFGPLRESSNPTEIRCGVVGTPRGIATYRKWVEQLSKAIPPPEGSKTSVFYPGFRELFNCSWNSTSAAEIPLAHTAITATLHRPNRHDAVHATVGLFANAISDFMRDEERRIDLWFVVIPDEVFELGRPQSRLPGYAQKIGPVPLMNLRLAKRLRREPSLFDEDMQAAEPFQYQIDFHNQLKARLIKIRAITQVIRESTLMQGTDSSVRRRLQDPATVAWNLSVSSFYKAGGHPWRLQQVRDGVCYVGLVFKRDVRDPDPAYACCGAQMFLSSGEGMVFKGIPGDHYRPALREFHLSKDQAAETASKIVSAYVNRVGEAPREVFVHGRTRPSDEEWAGFTSAVPTSTRICAVRITRNDELKLFRPGRMPVLRGTYVSDTSRIAYLWTSGFIPELETYPGWEVPNPLRIELCRGDADISTVVTDVLQLTKLNFNACIYADGLPVTLRFADSIGDILTAAPASDIPEAPLPFRHYI